MTSFDKKQKKMKTPAFNRPLYVGCPNVGNADVLKAKVTDMLDRRWFTNNGPFVQEFEKKLEKFLRVKHCIAICNATIALEIMTRANGITGEVIIPSFTFIATAHALQWQGITPVFCDINPKTHNIDPECVERMITPRTTGIIGVHLWGRPSDVEEYSRIAHKHNLKLMFDAAHAFGCSYNGRMIGGFGDAEVFSFHATKFLNTFEGGAVTTNDDELADKIRLMKNFGFSGYDNVSYIGTNGKMSEISAAMGLTGLESLEEFIAVNKRNYLAYKEGLADIPGLSIVNYNEAEQNNFQYIVLEIQQKNFGLSRDDLIKRLHAENIIARRYFYPGCHRMEPYRSSFPHAGLLLPQTEILSERILTLPTGTAVGKDEIHLICRIIRLAAAQSSAISNSISTPVPK